MMERRLKSHHQSKESNDSYQQQNLGRYLEGKKAPNNKTCLYIHVPFCAKICSFCSMRRYLGMPDSQYTEYIIKEIKAYGSLPYIRTASIDAVYFGGGTPTMMTGEDFARIIQAIEEFMPLAQGAEISVESTLSELHAEKLKDLGRAGVNRISLGVQTFDDEGRKLLGRNGSGQEAIKTIQSYHYSGIKNINVDFIYNYPSQNEEVVKNDIRLADELDIQGFSFYSLMNLSGKKPVQEGSDEKDYMLFSALVEEGLKKGYDFLENTKMVKGDQYRYVMNRLKGSDTIAIGAGAGGSLAHGKVSNPLDLQKYYDSVDYFEDKLIMTLSSEEAEKERIIQLISGQLQGGYLKKYYTRKFLSLRGRMLRHKGKGYFIERRESYYLTKKGIYWSNNIIKDLLQYLR